MPVQSKLADILPQDYGYVIFAAVGSTFLNTWLAFNVMKARKEHNIKYPVMYTDNEKFNCVQRAHQNMLETYPQFLIMLMLGGLQYPRISAAAGALYIAGRVAYALGYYTGNPDKRKWGTFGFIGVLTLLGNTISFACHQLKWVGK